MQRRPGHEQQTQRTLLDWLRVECRIEKPSNKLLALTELDPNTWVSEVKRIRGKKQPRSYAGFHALRDEYTCTIGGEGRRKKVECRTPRRDRPDVADRPASHACPKPEA